LSILSAMVRRRVATRRWLWALIHVAGVAALGWPGQAPWPPLLAWTQAQAAYAEQGFPGFDARDEVILFGHGVSPAAADTLGDWSANSDGLAVASYHIDKVNLWLATAAEASLGDGFVRLRLNTAKPLDTTLLLRTQRGAAGIGAVSGYGVVIDQERVQISRFDEGLASNTGASMKVAALGKATSLEVVVWMIGPHITAQVFDERLKPLATLTLTDARYSEGGVGVRAYSKQSERVRYTLLSVRAAGDKRGGARDVPVGPQRLVEVNAEGFEALPAWAREQGRRVDPPPGVGAPGHILWLSSPLGVELMRREGVEPARVSAQIPRWVTDSDMRRALGSVTPSFDSYFDADMVEARLKALHARYPGITQLVSLGRSREGRPIWALKISDNPTEDEDEPAVLFNGAHHGEELLSTDFVLDLIDGLLEGYRSGDDASRRYVSRFTIWCVPLVNPDGNMHHVHYASAEGRKNGRDVNGDGVHNPGEGVDLNRNYPWRWGPDTGSSGQAASPYYRGDAPGSEPETQAMMRLADAERFVASLSFHTLATKLLVPYTLDGVSNPLPDEAWPLAEALVAAAPLQPNGRSYVAAKNLYPVNGTDQDWLRFAHGTVALLLEGPLHNPSKPEQRLQALEGARPIWAGLLDRYLQGPTLAGHVRDADGLPIVAVITIDEVKLRAGERWSSRCRDGRFDRLLTKPGTYHVRAVAGGQEVMSEVRVSGSGVTALELTIPISGRALQVPAHCEADPSLCAAETWCRALKGGCPVIGEGGWCRVDEVCVPADTRAGACRRCDPARDAVAWSMQPAGTLCAEVACADDGGSHEPSVCDAGGACVQPSAQGQACREGACADTASSAPTAPTAPTGLTATTPPGLPADAGAAGVGERAGAPDVPAAGGPDPTEAPTASNDAQRAGSDSSDCAVRPRAATAHGWALWLVAGALAWSRRRVV
jgi:hypothetical protein